MVNLCGLRDMKLVFSLIFLMRSFLMRSFYSENMPRDDKNNYSGDVAKLTRRVSGLRVFHFLLMKFQNMFFIWKTVKPRTLLFLPIPFTQPMRGNQNEKFPLCKYYCLELFSLWFVKYFIFAFQLSKENMWDPWENSIKI